MRELQVGIGFFDVSFELLKGATLAEEGPQFCLMLLEMELDLRLSLIDLAGWRLSLEGSHFIVSDAAERFQAAVLARRLHLARHLAAADETETTESALLILEELAPDCSADLFV